jgi:subtilisin family serine protease
VTTEFGGTSSATPLVAAVTALVISANPQLTAAEAVSILKRTADKDLDLITYPRTPPAPFDLHPTWDVSPVAPYDDGKFTNVGDPHGTWSPWFGHGRVNAAAAVQEALRTRVEPPATEAASARART